MLKCESKTSLQRRQGGGEGGEEDSPLPDLSNFNLP